MSKNCSQVITCKAAVCWGVGEPLKIEEIQVEPPKSSEVRVKTLYASVCHTDIACINAFPTPLFPRVIGHEGVGVVESVGDKVTELREGDLVIPTFVGECQDCENCLSGKSNLCFTYPTPFHGLMLDGTSRLSVRGQKLYHIFTCSTWSEYMVIDANYVVKIDPSITLSHASFLSCGFPTGYGAAWKVAKVEEGSSVAVIGLGAVGLGIIEGARMQGAAKIIGIDMNEMKKAKGEAYGQTDFIYPKEFDKSISEVVKDLTGGMGVDYCFECTGVTPLSNEALEATKVGKGETIIIGVGKDSKVHIDYVPFACRRALKGCIFGGLKPKSDLPIMVDKYKKKEFQLDELLTHEVPLEDINKGIELLKQPDCVKVVVKIWLN